MAGIRDVIALNRLARTMQRSAPELTQTFAVWAQAQPSPARHPGAPRLSRWRTKAWTALAVSIAVLAGGLALLGHDSGALACGAGSLLAVTMATLMRLSGPPEPSTHRVPVQWSSLVWLSPAAVLPAWWASESSDVDRPLPNPARRRQRRKRKAGRDRSG